MPTTEELLKRIETLEKKVNHPIDISFQKTMEQAKFDKMDIRTAKIGLPIYTNVRTTSEITDLYSGESWIFYNPANEATYLQVYISSDVGTANIKTVQIL